MANQAGSMKVTGVCSFCNKLQSAVLTPQDLQLGGKTVICQTEGCSISIEGLPDDLITQFWVSKDGFAYRGILLTETGVVTPSTISVKAA